MKKRYIILLLVLAVLIIFGVFELVKKPNKVDNWREELSIPSTAEFLENKVLIKNVRNFRYDATETENTAGYYDKTYDLDKISKVWFIVEPFKAREYAAHTFLSFEFADGNFLTITIEARKKKGQEYGLILGMLHTYPLMYIVADERDSIIVRTNIRKDKVYLYPIKATPEQTKLLFVDILKRMNEIVENPVWYNTFFANCTSSIAFHVNKIWPGLLPSFQWQSWISGYAEKLVFDTHLIDTNLSLEKAREKYYITDKAQKIGDVPDFSKKIREGL
jgi:hypothetical protein